MKNLRILFTAVAVAFFATSFAQTQTVNIEKTTIKWEGKKIGGAHDGDIKLKKGNLTLKANHITDGLFVIDMNSITCRDIENAEYNAKLVGHLKSNDFFGVEKYPTAKLKITKTSKFKSGKATITGDLTIKAKTHPIEFEVSKNDDKYSTSLVVDRSKYDVKYGSKSFYDNLGDKVIYDDFTLNIELVTK